MNIRIGTITFVIMFDMLIIPNSVAGSVDYFLKQGSPEKAVLFFRAYYKDDFRLAVKYATHRTAILERKNLLTNRPYEKENKDGS